MPLLYKTNKALYFDSSSAVLNMFRGRVGNKFLFFYYFKV